MKKPAVGSIVANLVLAGWLFWPHHGSPERAVAGTGTTMKRPATPPVAKSLLEIHNVTPKAPAFDWSLVESEDYLKYMANLRRLEMPEWLIHELVLKELMRQYAVRAARLPECQPMYWLTHRQQHEYEVRQAKAKWALKEEEYAVLRELTGTYRNREAESIFDESEFAIFLGSLTTDQALEVVSELSHVSDRAEYLGDLYHGLFSPADREQLLADYRNARARLAASVPPALLEEFLLRLQILIGGLADNFTLPGMRLTGAQLRELVRIRSGFIDSLSWAITKQEKPGDAERVGLDGEVQKALTEKLGKETGDEYIRSQTPAFQALYELTQRHQMPVETAVAVYDVRQAAISAVRKVISSPDLDDDGRRELRRLIQQEAEKAVQSALGPVWNEYRQGDGSWMDRVGGQAAAAGSSGGGR